MSYKIIKKDTGELISDHRQIIDHENDYLIIEEPYSSLDEIWNIYKAPFLAENESGYFVIIEDDLDKMREKYNGNIYGKMDKSLKNILTKTYKQKIYNFGKWKFLSLYY